MSKNTGTSELINYFTLGASGAVDIGGNLTLSTITNATTDTDKFLVSDTGIIKYRTGAELLTDIGAAPATGGSYLPLAGGTLTGALNGTSATFSGDLIAASATLNTPAAGISMLLTGRSSDSLNQIRFNSNVGALNNFITSLPASLIIASQGSTPIEFITNNAVSSTPRMSISGAGIVTLTGALSGTSASFSSSVTAAAQSKFWDGTQGMYVGAFTGGSGFGAIYSTGVTPSGSNYTLALSATETDLSVPTGGTLNLQVNGANKLSIASTGAATFSAATAAITLTANGAANQWTTKILASSTTSQSYGLTVQAGTNASDIAFQVIPVSGSGSLLQILGTGAATFSSSVTSSLGSSAANFNSNGATTGAVNAYRISNTTGIASFGIDNSTGGDLMIGGLAYATLLQSVSNTALQLGTNQTARLTISTTGSVGIGTTNPLGKLDVYRAAGGSGTSAIVISNGEGGGRNWALSTEVVTAGDFAILCSSTTGGTPSPSSANSKLYITSGGNVLIGTTTDSGHKLRVNGTALIGAGISNFQTSTKTGSSGSTVTFLFGVDYGTGLGDNTSGLVIININEPNFNANGAASSYIGNVINPRGLGGSLTQISSLSGSGVSSFAVAISGNNINVTATISGGGQYRATMTFIGGGGTS